LTCESVLTIIRLSRKIEAKNLVSTRRARNIHGTGQLLRKKLYLTTKIGRKSKKEREIENNKQASCDLSAVFCLTAFQVSKGSTFRAYEIKHLFKISRREGFGKRNNRFRKVLL
jgi:hypothetical protein